MLGLQSRSFKASVRTDTPIEDVWSVLFDPQAMLWMHAGADLAAPVPGDPEAVGARRCGWRKRPDGALGCVVYEVVDIERPCRVVFLGRQQPEQQTRIKYRVEARLGGTEATVVMRQRRYRHAWANGFDTGARSEVKRLVKAWRRAAEGSVPEPADPRLVLPGASHSADQQTHQIHIEAPPDLIWKLLKDDEGTLLPNESRLARWRSQDGDIELLFQLLRMPNDGIACTVNRIIRPDPLCSISRGAYDIVSELAVGDRTNLLRLTYRWDSDKVALRGGAIKGAAEQFLNALKAVAETPGAGHQEAAEH